MESILAFVSELNLGQEWFKINSYFPFSFSIFHQDHSTEQNQAIGRGLLVQFKL